MSVMSQWYSVTIYRCICSTGHSKEMVNGLNAIDKRYIYKFLPNVQLKGSKTFDSQIIMHYCTENSYISQRKNFKKICL